jgi:uncharacterized protein YodC (DUF2158 family)
MRFKVGDIVYKSYTQEGDDLKSTDSYVPMTIEGIGNGMKGYQFYNCVWFEDTTLKKAAFIEWYLEDQETNFKRTNREDKLKQLGI